MNPIQKPALILILAFCNSGSVSLADSSGDATQLGCGQTRGVAASKSAIELQKEVQAATGVMTEEVPLYFDPTTKLPMVDCSFDGSTSKKGCILDTGSPVNIFPPNMNAFALSLKTLSEQHQLLGVGPINGCDTRSVAQLKIGNFVSSGQSVVRCDTFFAGKGDIGVPGLGLGIWKFDMKNNELINKSSFPAGLTAVKLGREGGSGHLFLPLTIGTTATWAMFDTGAPNTYVDASIYNKNKALFKYTGDAHLRGLSLKLYKVSGLRIGGTVLNNQPVAVADFSSEAPFKLQHDEGSLVLLGEDVIKNRVWYVDLKNNKWAIQEPMGTKAKSRRPASDGSQPSSGSPGLPPPQVW
jgi:hypothetical protein